MEFKKGMLILILAIFLVSIAAVCASDVNDTAIASEDANQIELSSGNEKLEDNLQTSEENTTVIQANDDEIVSAESDSQTLGEGEGTYYDLINEIGDGGDKSLTKSHYRYTGGESIEIINSGTINGNGAVIDMAGSNIRAFYVNAFDVTIKNLTIENANFNGDGGAVYFGSSGTVINCNFIGNQAKGSGGAIYFTNEGSAVDCNFINNSASGKYSDAGAVYFGSSGTVSNCNFTNNNATYFGGAVRFMIDGTVINCSFADNRALQGGAAYYTELGTVTNSNFANNCATNGQGGAVYSYQEAYVGADTCIFKTDSDSVYQTRILLPNFKVDNFITYYGSGEKLTFDLKTDSGIPIYDGNISISVYYNNDSWVGNYSCLSGDGWIVDLAVGNYYAIFNMEYEGFKSVQRTITVVPDNTFWALNHIINASDAFEVNLTGDYYYDPAYDAEFVNGIVINRNVTIKGNGNTINAKGKASVFNVEASNVTINNLNIENGKSKSYGGAIYFYSSGSVINCNFTNNSANDGSGGAIYFFSFGSVINCNFVDNRARNYGGALYFEYGSTGTIENCNFTNNTAKHGGAVGFDGTGTVTNCNFTDNEANYGGAVYFWVTGNVENCNFADNRASNQAGAIRMNLGNVSSCNFNNNSAKFGGAVYSFSGGNIRNCNFTDNQVNGSGGGAVRFDENGNVESCNFINNKAPSGNGGAIYFYQESSYVSDCIFVNNSAGNFSAVHLSPTGTISYCIFINNSADYGVVGNSVDAQGDTVIANNIFLNNKVILNVINFASTEKVNGDYNWFGNTADNYTSDVSSNTSNIWLFLNATAVPDSIPVLGTSNIVFSLYAYNKKTGDVFYYNNTLLKPVNLTLSATGGDVDNTVRLGNAVRYDAADSIGKGSVTAAIENVAYTIELSIKHNPDLSVSSQQVFYSNNTIITTSYNSSATGKVKIILKGKYNSYVLRRDLNTTISLGKIVPDDYKVSVIYYGDESFAPCNATGHLEVYPAVYLSVNITSDNDTYFIGDTVIWTIAIHNLDYSLEATNVTMAALFSSKFVLFGAFTDNGTYNLDEGVWQIGFMASGSTATLKLFGYGNSVGSHILNHVAVVCNEDNLGDMFGYNYIDLVDLSVIEKTSSDNNLYCGNEITYDLTISNNASINYTNTLSVVDSLPDGLKFVETLNISGADLLSETVDGKLITWNITNIAAGTNAVITIKVRATNTGSLTNNMTIISAIKNNHTVNCTVEVREKIKTELTANAVTTTYNVNKNLVITLKDVNGNPIGGAQITVNLNGAKNYTTDKNGQVKLATKSLASNTYKVTIRFNGDVSHIGCSKTTKVTVKEPTKLNASPLTTIYKEYKYLVAPLKDSNGKPLSNVKIYFKINGVTYKCKTNKKGNAKLIIRLKPKVYTAKITFKGNSKYAKTTQSVKVKVKKAKPKLTAKSKTFKKSVKTKKYTVTLKDNTKKAMKKVKLTLKVGKKTYKAKTNKKGKATFKIKKSAKGTYKAKVTYKGNIYFKKVTKKVKIKIK